MIKLISNLKKIFNINTKQILTILCFVILETLCYNFTPISFAKVVLHGTNQNFQLATLWAAINFLVQTLNIISINIKNSFILSLSKNNTTTSYLLVLSDLSLSTLKALSIIIIASIYSILLMTLTTVAILICSLSAIIISTKKHLPNVIIDIIWLIFTFILSLIIVHELSNLQITISAFLLFTSFINTHLTKPHFNTNTINSLKTLKDDTYFILPDCQNMTNKKNNITNTNKK